MSDSASNREKVEVLSHEQAQLLQLLLEKNSIHAGRILPAPRPTGELMEVPASWAQQRLWFLEQLEGASAAYHVPIVMRLEGILEKSALLRSLDYLVERHEVLRTTFVSREGEPHQRVAPNGSLPLQMFDLRGCDEATCENQIDLHQREEARTPF